MPCPPKAWSSNYESRIMKLQKINKIWVVLSILISVLIAAILYAAYLGEIPSFIGSVPYYDKIGHFVLYGMLSYVFWRVTNRKTVSKIPLSPTIITALTIAEELLQGLSSNRTAIYSDLIFSLAGVWMIIFIDRRFKRL